MNCTYVNRGRHLYECLVTCLRKAPIRTRIIGIYFSLSLTLFENINQEHIYCQTVHVFGQFTYVLACKNIFQASLPSFFLLAVFCLDQCQMENACLQLSIFVTGRR